MSDEKSQGSAGEIEPEAAAAIVAAVILHRSSVECEVQLLEGGESDQGFWGRSGRAGTSSVLSHRPRRAG
ncbi:MAG: hypothetical protein JRG91_11180 [Deltaproteobacteria bacterium]|nr:hypothetical protein [Deltaproteobacteria bacterium]